DGPERLPLPVAGRRRPRDEKELPLAGLARSVHRGDPDFPHIRALPLEGIPREPEVRGDIDDRAPWRLRCKLMIGDHATGTVTRNAGTLTTAPSSSFSITAGCSWPMMMGWSVETSSCPWTIVYPPMSARLFSGRLRSPRIVAR